MEKASSQSFFKLFLHFLRTIMIAVLSGAITGILAVVIDSFFNIER